MVARSKVLKAKWGIGAAEPDDLPDFLSNDEIIAKNDDQPPRGVFRMMVKGRPTVVKNSNGDDMIKMTLEVNETSKDKKSYNGFAVWENQNITDKGKPFLLKWLKSLGVTWKDFMTATKMQAATTIDPAEIISIGNVTFGGNKKVFLEAALGRKPARDGYDEGTEVKRWVEKGEVRKSGEDVDEDDADDDIDEDVDVEDEDEDEADDADEAEEELREELDELSLTDLKKRARENSKEADEPLSVADLKGKSKDDVIEIIVEQELAEEGDEEDEGEEDEDDSDEEAEEELREELGELTLAQLKKRAKENGRKIAEVRKSGQDDLIEMIVEDELGGEEDDGEPPF
jgi:hypothetical protein